MTLLHAGSANYIEQLAKHLITRHHGKDRAAQQCQRHIDDPTTEEAGKKFWRLVKQAVERQGQT